MGIVWIHTNMIVVLRSTPLHPVFLLSLGSRFCLWGARNVNTAKYPSKVYYILHQGSIILDVSMTDLLSMRNDCLRHIVSLWEKLSYFFDRNSFFFFFFFTFYLLLWPKLLIPSSLTQRVWVGITKTGEKLLLTHENPIPSMLQLIFLFFLLWGGKRVWGKMLPWRILCDRSFQFACLSLV